MQCCLVASAHGTEVINLVLLKLTMVHHYRSANLLLLLLLHHLLTSQKHLPRLWGFRHGSPFGTVNSFLLYRFAKVVAVEETAAEVLEVDGTGSIHIIGQNVKKNSASNLFGRIRQPLDMFNAETHKIAHGNNSTNFTTF